MPIQADKYSHALLSNWKMSDLAQIVDEQKTNCQKDFPYIYYVYHTLQFMLTRTTITECLIHVLCSMKESKGEQPGKNGLTVRGGVMVK